MKPAPVVMILSLGWLAIAQTAGGQSPAAKPQPFFLASANRLQTPLPADDSSWLWQSPPLPANPDVLLWADYRGVAIEHQFSLTRPRPIATLLQHCLDSLLGLVRLPRTLLTGGECRQSSMAAMLGCQGSQVTSDCGCFPPALPPAEAPVQTPVPLPLTEQGPETPVLRPVPTEDQENAQPPSAPPYLPPVRSPVVELAPDLPLPTESPSPPALPRNRVPKPGERLPRNIVPPR